jgi:hypothetical protein
MFWRFRIAFFVVLFLVLFPISLLIQFFALIGAIPFIASLFVSHKFYS